jgi:methionyl-tRNA formyltransferase
MTSEADAGDIVYQEAFPLQFWDIPHTVYLKVCQIAPQVILVGLRSLIDGTAEMTPQPEIAHVYKKSECQGFWKPYLLNRLRLVARMKPVYI